MTNSFTTVSNHDLIEAYLDALRPEVHDAVRIDRERKLAAFEAALGVRVPRSQDDISSDHLTDWLLFSRTVESALHVRTPMSGHHESDVVFERLDELSTRGARIAGLLNGIGDHAVRSRRLHTELLCDLLEVIVGRTDLTVTMLEVKATGLYPGAAVSGFDELDPLCTS